MNLAMRIATYDFHDGCIYSIRHVKDHVEFAMGSAEIDPMDMEDDISLASDNTIKGKLHLEGVKSIILNNEVFSKKLEMSYDDGDIFDFEIKNGKVTLIIIWKNFIFDTDREEFWVLGIEAEKIYWENIPDLKDLYLSSPKYIAQRMSDYEFRNGNIYGIKHENDCVELAISSAALDPEQVEDDITLSLDNKIKGKLHIEGLESVVVDGKPFLEKLRKDHDEYVVLRLEIDMCKVKLSMMWTDRSPKPERKGRFEIEMAAQKVYWENIPDLEEQ